MRRMLKEVLLGKGSTVEVYRGMLNDELMEEQRALTQHQEEYKKLHKALWEKVYAALGLESDRDLVINKLTGQVFECVPEDELGGEGGEGAVPPWRQINTLQKLIHDAERRLGSYVATLDSDDPYIQGQSKKIAAWMEQVTALLTHKE